MRTGTLVSLVALAVGASACSRCNNHDSSQATADAATTEATDASTATAPYLPARSAPDDSYAPNSQVESVLFSLRPGFNLCYRVAAQANPNLVAKAVFAVTIGGNGHVTSVELATSDPPQLDPDLVDCIRRAIAQGQFKPTPDGGVATINVPIAFRPPVGGFRPDAGVIGGGWNDAGR